MIHPFAYLLFFLPFLVPLFFKLVLKWNITWKEYAIQAVVGLAVCFAVWGIGRFSATGDHEVWNGQIVSKNVQRSVCVKNVPSTICRNSFPCEPRRVCSGSRSSRSCNTEYSTCYIYPYEQSWTAKSSVAGNFEIARVDPAGWQQPPRWSAVEVGQPAATLKFYNNWVKAASESLFNEDTMAEERYAKLLPNYPGQIVDYHYMDRIVTVGVKLTNEKAWNDALANQLRQLGPKRQMNVIFVISEGPARDFSGAVRRHWQGFKKNEAIVFIGLQQGKVEWAEVYSWSKNEIFNIEMRDAIYKYSGQAIGMVDPIKVMGDLQTTSANFVRRPMEEFEYLRGEIDPPMWLIIVSLILAIGGGILSSFLMHRYDLFNEETRTAYPWSGVNNRYKRNF